MYEKSKLQKMIETALPGAQVTVQGEDGQHFEVRVIYPGFAGKSLIEQHRMVYAALGDKMQQAIHALALKTAIK